MAKKSTRQNRVDTAAAQRKREQTALLLVVVGVVAIFVVILLVAVVPAAAPAALTGGAYSDVPQNTLEGGEPVLGNPDAPVMLVEFSNFSCPGCMQYSAEVETMIDRYVRTGRARIAFMPMVFDFGTHPSFIAAQASVCAGRQNGFWDMHHALFDLHRTRGPNAFTIDSVRTLADNLGLDAAAVVQCVQREEMAEVVNSAIQSAIRWEIRYTPTLLYSLDGGQTLRRFLQPDGTPYESRVPIDTVEALMAQYQ